MSIKFGTEVPKFYRKNLNKKKGLQNFTFALMKMTHFEGSDDVFVMKILNDKIKTKYLTL